MMRKLQLDLQIAKLKEDTLNEAPSRVTSKGPKGFRARADKLVADLSAGMEDSVVQKRFNNRAKVTLANAQIVVNNNARLRAIDAAKQPNMPGSSKLKLNSRALKAQTHWTDRKRTGAAISLRDRWRGQ